jgi:hypothetical protein
MFLTNNFNEQLKGINQCLDNDYFHDKKRILSFEYFDKLIEGCQKNICPTIDIDMWYHLIDISMENYINQRAYFYSIDNIGSDDNNRYYISNNRIEKIFNCERVTNLKKEIFNFDINQTQRNLCISEGIRKRKAYWTYLKYKPDNNIGEDYFNACYFIEKIYIIYHKNTFLENDLNYTKNLLRRNLHIANGIDLFRFCIIKEKIINMPVVV